MEALDSFKFIAMIIVDVSKIRLASDINSIIVVELSACLSNNLGPVVLQRVHKRYQFLCLRAFVLQIDR